jgi:hypothetical protein
VSLIRHLAGIQLTCVTVRWRRGESQATTMAGFLRGFIDGVDTVTASEIGPDPQECP